jgi:two-component system nitrate/nitrite response regulator NarL
MIHILVVGDIRLYRDSIAAHLAQQPELSVAGIAGTRGHALAQASATTPDVVLIDLAMPESLDTIRDLTAAVPGARIVALSVPEHERTVLACAEAGIAAYVLREGSLGDLVATVKGAVRGEAAISPRMAASMLRRLSALAHDLAPKPSAVLTAREMEVAALLGDGLSNKQIGARLNIELATVKNHVHNVLEKLKVSRRGDAARQLRRPAMLTPPEMARVLLDEI